MMMMKQKISLAERLNIGDEVRELKLGCTFNSKNTTNAFHTIKYDFKPLSVDKNRVATVDVGSNNQVTVTVPNLVSSGVPHTIYKGNQKKYTKECILIYDKETGDITLEKLNHNIQVKKTRSEMTNKTNVMPTLTGAGGGGGVVPMGVGAGSTTKLENSTMRVTSKTKVSTGSRRNTIIELKARNSPLQGSPSTGASNKSPQAAPVWNANNGQSTLPSIPMIVDDDEAVFGISGGSGSTNNHHLANISSTSSSTSNHSNSLNDYDFQQQQQHLQQQQQQSTLSNKQSKQSNHSSGNIHQKRHNNHQKQHNRHQQLQQQQQQQQQQSIQTQQQQVQQWQQQLQEQQRRQQQQQQQQQQYNLFNNSNGGGQNIANTSSSSSAFYSSSNSHVTKCNNDSNSTSNHQNQEHASSSTLASEAAALEMNIANELSSSSSTSDSDSSGSDSGSDSDDSTEDDRSTRPAQNSSQQLPSLSLGTLTSSPPLHMEYSNHTQNNSHHQHQYNQPQQQQHQQLNPSIANYASNGAFPNDLLQNDLQLSSNSSDDDSD